MAASFVQTLSNSVSKTIDYFLNDLKPDGSFQAEADDLACYAKSPMMFIGAGYEEQANKILDYIKNTFLFNGDFLTTIDNKTVQKAYIEYWPYINGWIVRAAQN
ncbi:unnamed protein product, partial [Didymodactylos carnosus]